MTKKDIYHLLEFPTKYANVCETVEELESDKLVPYNDNYYKYGSYYINKNDFTTKKRRKEK